jgi:hypothetical protein
VGDKTVCLLYFARCGNASAGAIFAAGQFSVFAWKPAADLIPGRGSRKESASIQKPAASVLIQSRYQL